jgi:hypothetical protein
MSNHHGRSVLLERLCNSHALGCEVFTAVVMKSHIFWDTMPCCPLQVDRRFWSNQLSRLFLLDLFGPEDGGVMILRNVG